MDILPLFCDIDDFCLLFEPAWRRRLLTSGALRRCKPSTLSLSEVMTILVLFHVSGYRDLKTFYTRHVAKQLGEEFPRLVSYGRFVELQREALVPLWCYLQTRKGSCTGIAFVDATTLAVCHNLRIPQHKVFSDCARRGKSSMGWFYGFKLHLVINECGELLSCYLTPGNVDDRRPVPHLVRALWGRLFGDKGYISQPLATLLQAQDLRLVTRLKTNMKNRFLPLCDKLLLRKRALIETVNDQLKNISQIEHTRHRSFWNFLGNVAAGLIAYTWREKKPSLNIQVKEQFLISN
jgi:Transposase DDE domain